MSTSRQSSVRSAHHGRNFHRGGIRAARSSERAAGARRGRACLFIALSLSAALSGCASLNSERPAPDDEAFKAFTKTIEELRGAADLVAEGLVEKSEARFRENLALEIRGERVDPDSLLSLVDVEFVVEGDALAIENAPYFLHLPAFKLGLYRSNSALVEYAQLLEALSAPGLIDDHASSQLVEELNGSAQSAALAINPELSAEAAGNVAVFSGIAGQQMTAYLKSRQYRDLIAVIRSNQPAIEEYTRHLQQGIRVLALARQHEFNQERDNYMLVFTNVELKPEDRISAALKTVDLVKDRFALQETLIKLHAAYGNLPAAHRDLANLKAGGAGSLDGIIALMETAKALEKTYQDTVDEARKGAVSAESKRADAVASAAEIEASKQAVEVAGLKVELEQAKAALSENPGRDDLVERVEVLATGLATQEQELERMLSNAKALREAANAVQKATDSLLEKME